MRLRSKKVADQNVVFTRDQAPVAIPNGTRVVKVCSAPDDAHQDGDPGVVIGSTGSGDALIYFVAWDDMPHVPVGVAEGRIAAEASGG